MREDEIPVGKATDLTGKVFGEWTVLYRVYHPTQTYWKCQCSCGTIRNVYASNLTKGKTTSCGCKISEKISKANKKDYIGKRFNYLTITKRHPTDKRKVFAKCDCGLEKEYYLSNITGEKTKSCGCQTTNLLRQNYEDLTGKVFERLTVLRMIDNVGKENHERIQCLCKCECGTELIVRASALKSGNTSSCGLCGFSEEKKRLEKSKDFIGKKFYMLTVLNPLPYDQNKSGQILWNCKCECGNTKIVSTSNLTTGKVKSCGCLKSSWGERQTSFLLEQNNISFIKEYRNPKCKDIRSLPFDFLITSITPNYIIEFDGEQHFKPFGFDKDYSRFEIIRYHDDVKNQWCKENNIPLIRIPYTKLNTLCIEDLMLETTQFRVV